MQGFWGDRLAELGNGDKYDGLTWNGGFRNSSVNRSGTLTGFSVLHCEVV